MLDFLQSLFNTSAANPTSALNPTSTLPPYLMNPQALAGMTGAQQNNSGQSGSSPGMPNLMQLLSQFTSQGQQSQQQQSQQPTINFPQAPMLQNRMNMMQKGMPTNTPMNNAMGAPMPSQSILPALLMRKRFLGSNNG
jgi:hypothetical protein